MITLEAAEEPVAQHVHESRSHVTRPNLKWNQKVGERSRQTSSQHEEDHDGAVNRDQGQIGVAIQGLRPGAHLPKNVSKMAKLSPGHPSCKRKNTESITAMMPMTMAVTKNCLEIIL